MVDHKLRERVEGSLISVEVGIYAVLGLLLAVTGILALAGAGKLLFDGVSKWTIATTTYDVLDRLLLVLMLVEILHTVRISIRSHTLVTEPFLVVGLIASIRRMLVITLEAADLTKAEKWTSGGESVFRASMLELGLLGGLILVLVFSILMLRRQDAVQNLTT